MKLQGRGDTRKQSAGRLLVRRRSRDNGEQKNWNDYYSFFIKQPRESSSRLREHEAGVGNAAKLICKQIGY